MKSIYFSILLIFMAYGLNLKEIGMIRFVEPVSAGDELAIHINLLNEGRYTFPSFKLSGYIPELELRSSVNLFDLGNNEKAAKWLFFDIPIGTKPGFYLVEISAIGKDDPMFHEKEYRYVQIV